MRFHELPVGQTFTYRGERYTKRSDLMAVHQESGKQQLIKRSTPVEPIGGAENAAGETALEGSLRAEAVTAAMEAFYQDCSRLLAEAVRGETPRARLEARLQRSRRAFLDKLNRD